MLDSSLHSAILLGIVLLWMFTETFGWVFAGFIVPGYLASMGIVAPVSLLCICIEAILTYGVTFILGTGAARFGLWHNVFGRERFLLFILVSIPIRILIEGQLPAQIESFLAMVSDNPSIQSGRFFGIGMVLVPLLANAWWKTGLAKGVLQMGFVSGICYLILEYFLSQYTNFHFGGFELTFENIAVDFLSIPKPYIILVMTAMVSARNNIRFGWNFGGILLPSLLAVVALSPLKFSTTILEIIFLCILYKNIVRLPWVRTLNLSGPRQIVTMYILSFLLKWFMAEVAQYLQLDFYISDFYGFGYLLTSLVAIRCLQDSIPRTMIPLLYTTAQGLILGLGLSLWLSYLLPQEIEQVEYIENGLSEVSLEQSILLSTSNVRDDFPEDGLSDNYFNNHLLLLQQLMLHQSADGLAKAASEFKDPNLILEWALREDNHRCLAIRTRRSTAESPISHPSFWWCGGQGPGLVVIHPKNDPDSLWLTAWLAQNSRPSFVLVAAIDPPPKEVAENTTQRIQLERRFKQLRGALGSHSILLIRSGEDSYLDPRSSKTTEHITSRLGPLSQPAVRFSSSQGIYQLWWDRLRDSDGVLQLSVDLLEDELASSVTPIPVEEVITDSETGNERDNAGGDEPDGLQGWLKMVSQTPLHKISGSESLQERFSISDTLLERVNRVSKTHSGPPPESLKWLASQFDVDIQYIKDGDNEYWVMGEGVKTPAGFGFWVFRLNKATGWYLIVPNSEDERGSAPLGIQLLEEMDARVFWMSGHGTYFGTSSMLRSLSKQVPLQPLMLRSLMLTESSEQQILMLRRQPAGAWDSTMLQLSFGVETLSEEAIDARVEPIQDILKWWPNYGLENGQRATTSMNTSGQFPIKYISTLDRGEIITFWLAPEAMAELDGSFEKVDWKIWYNEHNVEWLKNDSYSAFIQRLTPLRLTNPAAQSVLHDHANTRTEEPLKLAQRMGKIIVLDNGIRLTYAMELRNMVCLATGGTKPEDDFPFAGCWEKSQ
jgi:hypothetical protein